MINHLQLLLVTHVKFDFLTSHKGVFFFFFENNKYFSTQAHKEVINLVLARIF